MGLKLGRTIYLERKRKNWTIKNLIKKIKKINKEGISIGYIHNIEQGIRIPSFKWLDLIATVLNLDVNRLRALSESDETRMKKNRLKEKMAEKYKGDKDE